MNQKDIVKPLIVFILSCAVGLAITFFGLRFYYDDTRLEKELTRSYSASKIDVLAGKGEVKDGALFVSDIQPDGFSFINVGLLHIDSRFYEKMSISFTAKHPYQPLLLAVKHQESEQPLERPVPYSKQLVQSFLMRDIAPNHKVITDVGLVTGNLVEPYQIQSFNFVPKKINYTDFAYLLADCFAINKQWENWSINTHRSPHWVLIPPKILVLIYFTVVGLLFLAYLRVTRRPLINAWWATLVAAWFALDAHYLVEKTVITKNTYDTYAHLSADEKDLVLSPAAAKIAQMIKSVLPDDGKPKKIRIQLGWEEYSLGVKDSDKRYLSGKLHYMLQPNIVYTLGRKIPSEMWRKGGFYYVDVRQLPQRLVYDTEKNVLTVEESQDILAERLLEGREMSIYYILGGK